MFNVKKAILLYLMFLSVASIAQIHVLSGTNVTIAPGTSISFDAAAADTFRIDAGAQVENNGTITLSPSQFISEAPNFPVTGAGHEDYVNTYSTPVTALNPGGLGLVLTSAGAPDSLWVKRYHNPLSNYGANGIARNYKVTSESNSGLSASATLNYDVTELNGNNQNNLILYQSNNSGLDWEVINGTAFAGYVQSLPNTIDSFSLFTLFSYDFRIDSLNALSFYHGDSIKIYYTMNGMLNAGNVLKFEFSDTSGNFSIPFVLDSISAFNGNGVLTKAIPTALVPGVEYRVRLKTTDIAMLSADNGNDIIIMEPLPASVDNLIQKPDCSIYPNPANAVLFVKGERISRITVTDKLGRLVLQKTTSEQPQLSIDISSLPSAVYHIAIETPDRVFYKKFVKN